MRRVLFVDDDAEILEGLQQGMRRHRRKWRVALAGGAEEALAELAREPVDVVVSDMRMPGQDGAALLGEIRRRHPAVIRMVLSGYAERDASLRLVPVAHQFFSKPLTIDQLENALERSCRLRELIGSARIRELVGGIHNLPTAPSIYTLFNEMLARRDVNADQVAALIGHDVALAGKLLQLANSSFFAPALPISSVQQAVVRLGFQLVRDLALGAQLFDDARRGPLPDNFSIDCLQARAALAARLARSMLADADGIDNHSDAATTAALLHGIGQLLLAAHHGREYAAVLEAAESDPRPLAAVERELLGASAGEVGAYLLSLWGLPLEVVEAVTHCAEPRAAEQAEMPGEFGVLGAVHAAVALATEALPAPPGSAAVVPVALDCDYLEQLGQLQRLDGWRELCREHAAAGAAS